uniref:hypothetical protein n=1 Tax=Thaumasiovibrio occultus TaxID=1891184 RepID=UPI000B350CD1|nr:hypothetical protein [Thaumasiovibrio occultus]
MKKTAVALLTALALTGCVTTQPGEQESLANQAYVNAVLALGQNSAASVDTYESVLAAYDTIINKYPDTEIAGQLASEKLTFNGLTRDDIERKIAQVAVFEQIQGDIPLLTFVAEAAAGGYWDPEPMYKLLENLYRFGKYEEASKLVEFSAKYYDDFDPYYVYQDELDENALAWMFATGDILNIIDMMDQTSSYERQVKIIVPILHDSVDSTGGANDSLKALADEFDFEDYRLQRWVAYRLMYNGKLLEAFEAAKEIDEDTFKRNTYDALIHAARDNKRQADALFKAMAAEQEANPVDFFDYTVSPMEFFPELDSAKQLEQLRLAIAQEDAKDDSNWLSVAQASIATSYHYLGQEEDARQALRNAEDEAVIEYRDYDVLWPNLVIADVYALMGDEQMMNIYIEAEDVLDYYEGDTYLDAQRAYARFILAQVQHDNGDRSESEATITEALDFLAKANLDLDTSWALEPLADAVLQGKLELTDAHKSQLGMLVANLEGADELVEEMAVFVN